jgi:methyl acetate hydrolase
MACDREGTIYEDAFGERTLGSGQAMTLDTVGWIASMTKAVTSVAAVQCAERGQIDLDALACKVVPAIGEAQVLTGFDANGRPTYRAPRRPVTLRHLLTHSAGFSREIWSTKPRPAEALAQSVPAALVIGATKTCVHNPMPPAAATRKRTRAAVPGPASPGA